MLSHVTTNTCDCVFLMTFIFNCYCFTIYLCKPLLWKTFQYAASVGDLESIKKMTSAGQDINAVDMVTYYVLSPLEVAEVNYLLGWRHCSHVKCSRP